jgi:hypothetical protein
LALKASSGSDGRVVKRTGDVRFALLFYKDRWDTSVLWSVLFSRLDPRFDTRFVTVVFGYAYQMVTQIAS